MVKKWIHRKMYTRKSTVFCGEFYRDINGVPFDSLGWAFCPRCDAHEDNQIEAASVTQHELYVEYGTIQSYFRCIHCGLHYNYIREGVLLT